MKILEVDNFEKKIKIGIPITKPTGKIRIKERRSYTDFGIPVATRRKPFNRNMYVEWQIGYDVELNSKRAALSTLNSDSLSFTAYNKKKKILYELSEYFYYFSKMGVITSDEIDSLIQFVEKIPEEQLIENVYRIYKSNPVKKELNNLVFLESEVKYPHLIYDFNNGFLAIAEITIREKQKAVGIQPMLYICFPVSCLKDKEGKTLLGRTARQNEVAILELDRSKAFIVKESFKIFGMLSKSHRHDVLEILQLIKEALI